MGVDFAIAIFNVHAHVTCMRGCPYVNRQKNGSHLLQLELCIP